MIPPDIDLIGVIVTNISHFQIQSILIIFPVFYTPKLYTISK